MVPARARARNDSICAKHALKAAGSVVLADTLIPSGQLWAGNPAKYIRDISEEEGQNFEKVAEQTSLLASEHAEEFLPYGTVYQEAEKLTK